MQDQAVLEKCYAIVGIRAAYAKLRVLKKPDCLNDFPYDRYLDKYLKYAALESGDSSVLKGVFTERLEKIKELANTLSPWTYECCYIRALMYLHFAIGEKLTGNEDRAKNELANAVILIQDMDYVSATGYE